MLSRTRRVSVKPGQTQLTRMPFAAVVERQAPRQPSEAGLRGRVGKEALERDRGVDRGDVDDRPSPAREHVREDVLRAQPGRLEVDAEERVPLGLGHRRGVEIRVHARVVDEHVGRTESRHAGGDETCHVRFGRHVGGDEERARSLRGRSRLGVTSAEADRQPVGDQSLDRGETDSARSTRDNRDRRDIITVSMEIEIVHPAADELGESPVWLGDGGQLLRVDINAPAIVLRDASGSERRREMSAPVGFALPAAGGAFVAGIGRTLTRLADFDAAAEPLSEVEPQHHDNRFNDAACDPRGRLWAGTMSTTRAPGTAALYRIEAGGPPMVAIAGATISNGLDWNLDATRLYYVDSPTQRIDALDFDVDRGRLGARRPFVYIDPADGLPDGLSVDAAGRRLDRALRRRRDPPLHAQRRTRRAHRAARDATRPVLAFGGSNRDELFVTSARHRLTPAQRAREPLAGSLLRLRPGVSGRAANVFGAGAG